ncbi:Cytochrome P450 monooxygenase [Psilocybe cubensis]|uniref:Cytochrome P450 monooxygenase n=1 Tax=Psilocybe cubensis TaxID=181762 RepID=A0ACB8HH60_PSICU|nr:Cytochrome P450 monooxygenase [Psilocybe cubensis]KAH9487035.1 Cytochrome P450 monooxygenase [Psilocybe cubensis]
MRNPYQKHQPTPLPDTQNILKAAVILLEQLLQKPEEFSAHIRQYAGSIVLRVAYGYEVKAENDFYIALVKKAMPPLLQVVHAGKFLVEFIPALKHIPSWFPGATFKKNATIWAKDTRALRDAPFEKVKKAIEEGTAEQSYVSDNLEKLKINGVVDASEEEIVKNCAGIMYLAGSDTTASVLHSFLLAMVHHPEIQRRAQEEIDSVIGDSRLPDFNDRESLPYVEAILLETLRWAPVTPLSLPHRVIEEDEYEGYHIPAGAVVTPNVWAIMHSEDIYPEPFKFNPDRYYKGSNKEPLQVDPIAAGAFGFGRRICPGRYLALNSAWIGVCSILSAFNISKAIDNTGKVIEPVIEYQDGLVSHAKAFKLTITPRSEKIKKCIEIYST